MKIISLLFFFSGIAALTYEVLWVRHLGLIFGNTVYAAATVMTTYMFGLAVGAHFSGKWASRIKRPVRLFGLLEIATALYALCVPLLFELIQHLYRFAALHISSSMAFLTFVRVLLALILLLIPTAMMGATLPVLSKGFLMRVEKFGSRLGILYGVNTMGAVAGVLLCGFVLIPQLGMSLSNMAAVSLDLSVGIIAVVLSRKMDHSVEMTEALATETSADEAYRGPRGKAANGLLLAIGASGFLALAFEVVWFRALILVFGSTTYSFSAMLSVFLIGLSLGSMLISCFADKVKRPAYVFGMAAMSTGIYTLISLGWFTAMPEFLLKHLMLNGTPEWSTMILLKFVITLIFLLVPTMLFGASFTAAVKAIRTAMKSSPRAVGEAAMFNTIGAALGAFVGGFLLLPTLGMEKSLVLCAFLVLLLGLALCLSFGSGRFSRGIAAGMTLIFALVFFIVPHEWDKQILSAGPYFSPWNYVKNGRVLLKDQIRSERLLYFNEGVTSTISVIKTPDEKRSYCSQGKVEADTSERSMMLQRMMGHLPMLFHPNPQRILNIGLGAGVTFGAVGCYPAEHMEVVEIEPSVRHVADVWKDYNHNVINNPKVTVTINDGRNHLFVGGEPYDVITSDPFEPVMAGAANLYTVDFFEQAKAQLAEGGIMAQYLPLYELSAENYATIMRSFAKVFPDCLLFFTGFDTIMLGGKEKDTLRLPIAHAKFEMQSVRDSLAEVGFTTPEMLLSMFVARLKVDDAMFGEGSLNTDKHPVIEFSAPKHTFHYTPHENQRILLDNFSDVPPELMEGLSGAEKDVVAKSHEALRMTLQANILKANGLLRQCVDLLIKAAELSPENPVVRNEIAASFISSAEGMQSVGNWSQAIVQYEMALKYEPSEFWALYHLVNLNMRRNNVKEAVKYLNLGIEQYYKDSPLFIGLRGKMRGSMGDPAGACADLRLALGMLPNSVELWSDYGFFLQQAGDSAGATAAKKKIERLSK
ncbi:MAG: fused MFS/spermidine synthase [Kiritimatiellales bacterium]|nr:fused MFS/spermidine synthase [Kiritimatiellales bacterium]MCF7863175.1 fused MFS/spermidine synthase [Kiritimatiellales bacterium]